MARDPYVVTEQTENGPQRVVSHTTRTDHGFGPLVPVYYEFDDGEEAENFVRGMNNNEQTRRYYLTTASEWE